MFFFRIWPLKNSTQAKPNPGARESGRADGVARDGWESEKQILSSLTERKRCV